MCHRTFPPRKVGKRTFAPNTPIYFCEAFGFPKDFSRKVLWSRFGADSPNIQRHKKARQCRAFYFFIIWLELRSKPCFKALLKKHLKNPQNFCTETHHFILARAFEIPKDFSRKALWSGFGADSPNIQRHTKKHGIAVLFILTLLNLRIFANGIFYHFKHTHSTLFHERARKRSAFDRRNDAFNIAP